MQPCLQHFVAGCATLGAFGAAPNPPLATTRPCAPSVDTSITCWAIVNLVNVIRLERCQRRLCRSRLHLMGFAVGSSAQNGSVWLAKQ